MTHQRTHSPTPRAAAVRPAETALPDTALARPATAASPDPATYRARGARDSAWKLATAAERTELRHRADEAVGIGGF